MNYIKVKGYDNLYRDSVTGAIINTDKSVRDSSGKNNNGAVVIKQLQSEVQVLKNELSEIKNLLREIVRNGST